MTDQLQTAQAGSSAKTQAERELARLHTSRSGLTSEEARARLDQYGANEAIVHPRTGLAELWALCSNPLVIILLIASAVSAGLGEVVNSGIIALIVLVSLTLNLVQTYRSHRAVEELRAEVAPTATVLRDGNWSEVPGREVVPGDMIRLSGGDLVPADAILIESRDLHVQQAALTGESLPTEKHASEECSFTDPASATNRVFLGTSVVSGTATALVTATGKNTTFGAVAQRLAVRPPETEFDRGLRRFGLLIMRTVVFLVLLVFLLLTAIRHQPLDSLIFAVALAVGLTPEFLPMITTVTLGRGAIRMARKKVVVKHLSAIQNFGSMDILCSDKTGTLTSGAMQLEEATDALGNPSERVFFLAYLNSFHETGIPHPFNEAILKQAHAQPLDIAVLQHGHPNVEQYKKMDEIPFDFERRCLSVVVEGGDQRLLITKGAPESVLEKCSQYEGPGVRSPMTTEARAQIAHRCRQSSVAGFRVLAVAFREIAEKTSYGVADERDLVLAGLLNFVDPPLPGAAAALHQLSRDGVEIKILTGDNDAVARHVCSKMGLTEGEIVLGSDIDAMTDPALAHVAETARVFARVSPAQKNRVLLALKSRGHVVGFLGDGINDAPSLHAADVGISVATATDVAKDAADIILLERGLQVLHRGIMEGRRAFANVMKYLLMGTSSNFGNMFSMAAASVVLPFLPMLPGQILLNNFLYDVAQITIPTDNVDMTYMRKPRRWDIGLIRRFMVYIGPISSLYDFLTFWLLLSVFHAGEQLFHTGWFIESLATQTLVLFVIRTAGNPLKSRPSRALTLTTLVVVAFGCALPLLPGAQAIGFVPMPWLFYVALAAMTLTYLLLVEVGKRFLLAPHRA